ncbi:hypothetical protein PRZ48_013457 [Zasmidium cellare]|uniref:Uncharacterized protein n=1 Tax=Zasmidium cellare TaxID=395010 RepID=A0ABR0E1H6_ZASCE|nr:hypothetical protein PRZ48_013457 [Zasmidium cellare]
MPGSKLRLYVALYPSGVVDNEQQKYHWGLLIGPKNESGPNVPGTRFHVKNLAWEGWKYEEHDLPNVRCSNSLLARILVAKVEDRARLVSILRNVPIVQNDPKWRCRTWIASALEALRRDGKAVGTSEMSWERIEAKGREYVAGKMASGRYKQEPRELAKPRPTWDLIVNKETVK